MSETPGPDAESRVDVAVIGGGVAGLTAALRLAGRGYRVTLLEKSETLGGNLSSTRIGDRCFDVYPHMFPGWYANFWEIFETDLGLEREAHFAAQATIKLRRKGETGYVDLYNPTTPETIWRNLTSGVLPPADLFLLGFHTLDVASHPFDARGLSRRQTVNGHLYSRGYATDRVADFSDYILQLIWSISSDVTSAPAYQDFVKHLFQFPNVAPFAWMLRGDVQSQVMGPWQAKLESLGCVIRTGAAVLAIETDGETSTLTLDGGERVAAESLILAVPPTVMASLAMTGPKGRRLVDHEPRLARSRRLRSESIPVATITFKTTLPDVPREIIGLLDSEQSLSVIDISQLWDLAPPAPGRTVLVLACSDRYAVPARTGKERGWDMIRTLADYLPLFDPGAHWDDPHCDIDWALSRYTENSRHKIHLDQVGDDPGMPEAAYDALPGVYFAGDFCRTDVQMATIEAAVQSGVLAAQAVQKRRPLGAPITMARHAVYSETALLTAKLLLLPFAYAAAAWSHAADQQANLEADPPPTDATAPVAALAVLPSAYLKDLSTTLVDLGRALSRRAAPDGDTVVETPDLMALATPLAAAARRMLEAARAGAARSPASAPADPPPRYQRRWRVKP